MLSIIRRGSGLDWWSGGEDPRSCCGQLLTAPVHQTDHSEPSSHAPCNEWSASSTGRSTHRQHSCPRHGEMVGRPRVRPTGLESAARVAVYASGSERCSLPSRAARRLGKLETAYLGPCVGLAGVAEPHSADPRRTRRRRWPGRRLPASRSRRRMLPGIAVAAVARSSSFPAAATKYVLGSEDSRYSSSTPLSTGACPRYSR